jgi:tryptophan 2,3-dioxygenase
MADPDDPQPAVPSPPRRPPDYFAFDVATYVRQSRSRGRRHLDAAVRAQAVSAFRAARAAIGDGAAAPADARIARLAEAVLSAEWALSQHGGKRYVAYANMRALNWALGTNRRRPVVQVTQSCRDVLRRTVASWLAYELRTAAGEDTWNQAEVPVERLDDRIALLRRLAAGLGVEPAPARPEPPRSWGAYAADPDLVVEFLTTLPQTTNHDEVAFLRTIHISECCFWATLVHVMAATASLKDGKPAEAVASLHEATRFADTLGDALQVLQTMPPNAFLDFGGLTGDASGLQSRSYQLLQIHLFGVDHEKVEILGLVPELRDLLFYANPRFVPLKEALLRARAACVPIEDVLQAASRLDASMYRWRARHKGVSIHYLTDEVLTGVAGKDYLARHYRHRLFTKCGALDETPPAPGVRPPAGVHTRPVLTVLN